MLVDGYELTVALARSRRVAPDGGFVFAVGGDEGGLSLNTASSTARLSTSMFPVEEPMKTLTPQTRRIGLEHLIEVVVGRPMKNE